MSDRCALTQNVINALEITAGGHTLHKHAMWQLCELLKELVPSDLTAPETMAVVTILANAHERKLLTPHSPLRPVVTELREGVV